MRSILRLRVLGILLATACASDGEDRMQDAVADVEGRTEAALASNADLKATDTETGTAVAGGDRAQTCDEEKLLAPHDGALTLQDIPKSAVRAEFRPDLYRSLAPMFESSGLLADGLLLPDGKPLNGHVIFRAKGPTANLIVLFDGQLPCARGGCVMFAYQENSVSKALSRIYLVSRRTTSLGWGPPLAVFDECGVQSIYFVDSLDNKESAPDRFRSRRKDSEIVFVLTAKPLGE